MEGRAKSKVGLTTIALVAGFLAMQTWGTVAGAASLPKPPKKVSGVIATPGVGVITISWNQVDPVGTTYTVSSLPAGNGCQVVDQKSCTVIATTSTPWRFSVTASNGAGTSAASSLTRVLPHRELLVVSGQSNALGATSYANDPVTGINYFGRPYRDAADSKSNITWPGWWELAPPVTATGLVSIDTPQILNFVSPPTQIFGPEVGLARQIWTDTQQAVTIDKVVYSNSSLGVDWNPGTSGGIFSDMIGIVDKTMAADAARGQLDAIGGFYWYQGESDALDPTLYPAYQANLANFIANVRSRLPINGDAPIVLVKESLAEVIASQQYGGICASPNCATLIAGDTAVRAADDWAATTVPHVLTVDSLGLPRTAANGGIHLANTGELVLGEKLAQASDHLFP